MMAPPFGRRGGVKRWCVAYLAVALASTGTVDLSGWNIAPRHPPDAIRMSGEPISPKDKRLEEGTWDEDSQPSVRSNRLPAGTLRVPRKGYDARRIRRYWKGFRGARGAGQGAVRRGSER
jgi:hypothetical protein